MSAMDTHLLAIEPLIRLTAFAAVFAGMVAWEAAAPRRPRAHPRRVRWTGNLLMAALNSALLRVAFPTAAVAVAIAGEAQGAGLLNHTDLAGWIRLLIGFLAL